MTVKLNDQLLFMPLGKECQKPTKASVLHFGGKKPSQHSSCLESSLHDPKMDGSHLLSEFTMANLFAIIQLSPYWQKH